ncbi:MAG: TRAP transporter large permease [Syntrophaceae bacterium]|nr:TRAP transporter large permease [Syntrophaceae bacterium]
MIITFALLFILLVVGCPVGLTLLVVGAAGMWLAGGLDVMLAVLGSVPYNSVAAWGLVVVPMFVLMGEMMASANFQVDAFEAARRWVGRLPGGLAISSVLVCAMMACCCGSGMATTATMGRVAIGEMERHGYKDYFAAGCIPLSGSLAVMIPPSTMLVFYAMLTHQPIGPQLMAGILPGILLIILYVLTVLTWAKVNPSLAPAVTERFTWGERFSSLGKMWPMFLVFFIIIGGIYSGIATAVEVSAIGGAATLLIWAARRNFSFSGISAPLKGTASITASMFVIVLGAMVFSKFTSYIGLPFVMVDFIEGLNWPPLGVIFVIMGIYAVLGLFLEPLCMVMITIPFFFPIVEALGFNPLWFGILVTAQAELGVATPPIGLHLFVVARVCPHISVEKIMRGVVPFVVVHSIGIVILVLFPKISLLIPMAMMK